VLIEQGLMEMKAVAQDGMRVRAAAGTSSFRTKERLAELQNQCRQQIELLKAELDEQPDAASKRQKAARERAQRERQERLERAAATAKCLEQEAEANREKQRKKPSGPEDTKKPRASTTDPDARVMKMANGGFEPAYNIQYVTDTATGLVLGYDVINSGVDYKTLKPLNDQLNQRYGKRPQAVLADAGYREHQDITDTEKLGTMVYLPLMKPKDRPPKRVRNRDTAEVLCWRKRMETPEAKQLYKKRSPTAEFTNARARNHCLIQFCVRGLEKVKSIALWHALAINLRTSFRLGLA
jgi:hypothetical protein